MVGIVRNKRIIFENRADFERFEKRISKGVTNNVTKKMLDEKTKNIKITRGSENVPKGL
ncbi:hypothetical protein AB9M75_04135 [Lactobacillus sp. AN1001]